MHDDTVCGINEENWTACLVGSGVTSVLASVSGAVYLWIYGDFSKLPNYAEPIWIGVALGMGFIALVCGVSLLKLKSCKQKHTG